eukprot:601489-Hanusia_phi.AAC.4
MMMMMEKMWERKKRKMNLNETWFTFSLTTIPLAPAEPGDQALAGPCSKLSPSSLRPCERRDQEGGGELTRCPCADQILRATYATSVDEEEENFDEV